MNLGSHLWSDCVPFWEGVVVGARLDLDKRDKLTALCLTKNYNRVEFTCGLEKPERQNKASNNHNYHLRNIEIQPGRTSGAGPRPRKAGSQPARCIRSPLKISILKK